jgi:hypothetical protein
VDPARFHGTCYRAANWQRLGRTFGSGKRGPGYVYHGARKEVYVYVLEPRFRHLIGCAQQPYCPSHRPPPSLAKVEDLHMILRHADWNPELLPGMTLTEADCAALADELVAFHAQFQVCFGRIEHRRLGLAYLSGLLSHTAAKSVEPIALALLDADAVRPLQRFLKTYGWDDAAMEATHQALLAETLAAPDGMLTVDSCEFPKKGTESVGVARQYCGACGKVDNCQSGVFVGYASRKGYGLVTSRLYVPESWFAPEQAERRRDTRVPEDLGFQTKPQIAQALLARLAQTQRFPATWLGCDTVFGANWAFLDAVPPGVCYFAGIRSDTLVFRTRPRVHVPRYRGRGRQPTQPRVTRGRAVPVSTLARRKVSLDSGGARGRGEGAHPGRGRRAPRLPRPGRPAACRPGLAVPPPHGGRAAQVRLLECPGRHAPGRAVPRGHPALAHRAVLPGREEPGRHGSL